jgi:cytochrome P450
MLILSFLLFGSGSRVCVGKKFVIVEMTTLLASILRRYEIKLSLDSNLDPMPKIENYILHFFPSPKLRLVLRNC